MTPPTPGREVDARIQREVFGSRVERRHGNPLSNGMWDDCEHDEAQGMLFEDVYWHEYPSSPAWGYWMQVPRYTTDPADDYEVLKKVREEWPDHTSEGEDMQAKWMIEMDRIIMERTGEARDHRWIDTTLGDILYYQPGDYARAALAVLVKEGATHDEA